MADSDRFPEAYRIACKALLAYTRGEQLMSVSIGGERLQPVSRGSSERIRVVYEPGIDSQPGDGVPRQLSVGDALTLARGFANRLLREIRIDGAAFEEAVWRFLHGERTGW